MKKNHKKACGFLGLALVVATTVFAASLDGQNVSAAEATNSITDVIQVRVVGDEPSLTLADTTSVPEGSIIYVESSRETTFEYFNADSISLKLTYTPISAITSNSSESAFLKNLATLASLTPAPSAESETVIFFQNEVVDYVDGNGTLTIDLDSGTYTVVRTNSTNIDGDLPYFGYGYYLLTFEAQNAKGVTEQYLEYAYFPLWMDLEKVDDNSIGLTFKYSPEIVDHVKAVLVRDSDGKEIKTFELNSSDLTKLYQIDLVSLGLLDGTYSIKATPYDEDDSALGVIFIRKFDFENKTIKIPDTGYFLESIGASKNDLLATVLIAFLLIVIVAFIFTARRGLKATRSISSKKSVKSVKHSVKPASQKFHSTTQNRKTSSTHSKTAKKSTLRPIKTIKAKKK